MRFSGKVFEILGVVIPVLIACMGLIAVITDILGIIELSTSEEIIVAILSLLAIDALLERKGILEGIRANIKQVLSTVSNEDESRPVVIWEKELVNEHPFDERLAETKVLFISGGSLIGLMREQQSHIEDWLTKDPDTRLHLILENPNSALVGTTPVWSHRVTKDTESDADSTVSLITRDIYSEDIQRTLRIITPWNKQFPERVKVRLTTQVPSMTVMFFDNSRATVSLNLFLGGPELRPVFEIFRRKHLKWFNLFSERYRAKLWEEATEWVA